MHILAVIMLHQHKFCVYKGKRHLELPITCDTELCTFCALSDYILLCNYFLETNMEKSLQSVGFRAGRSGYTTDAQADLLLCC